jgi:general secretion pathway protein D
MSMNHTPRKLQRATAVALAAVLAVPAPLWAQPTPAPAAAPAAAPVPAVTASPVRPPGPVSPAMRSSARVTLNFVNADIEAVTRAFAAMIDRQIVVDPRVKGSVTVYSEQPLTIREAYLTYLSALRGLGFAVVDSAGVLKVLPEADARLQATPVVTGSAGARAGQILTQIFTLKHENPNNLVPILRPLITANNTINVNPGTSSLIITDYAENLQRLATIITTLDQPSTTDFEVVPLEHAVAADVAAIVQRLADGSGAAQAAPGAPVAAGGSTSVIADNRSNSLIIRAPNQARLQSLRAAIARLDRPSTGGPGGNIWVVHLKNADATRLAAVLRAAFGGGGNTSTGTAGAARTGLLNTGATGANPQAGGAAGANTAATAPIAASAEPSTGGFVQADPATNSLIITAPEPLYRQVRAMIDQLDTRRAQIYIESLIVEVSGSDLADFGFQWQGLSGQRGDSTLIAGGTSFGTSSIVDLSVAAIGGRTTAAAALQALPGGLNIGVLRNLGNGLYGLSAVARALQDRGNTNIMSTPNLITVDNEEAKIVVGDNVPFITGSFTNTGTATTNPFQTIERRDVGLTLRIRPQIGEGGTVRMAIFQESSSVSAPAAGTTGAGPTTSKRAIESNVIVDDGAILVLGGLIEDRFIENKSKVPVLGDIPYVGALFRSESRERKRTNLMVFLRPIVMRTADDANRLSLDRYDLIRSSQKDAQPARNPLLPIQEGPVLPPLRPEASPAPGRPAAPGN